MCGVTHDSRTVRPGDLYAALPGTRAHGAEFSAAAVAAGAVAILTDPAGRDRAAAAGRARLRGRRPAGPARRGRLLGVRRPQPEAAADRRDRDQRQDHHELPGRGRAADGRPRHRPDRRGGDADRRPTSQRQRAHHPRGHRPAGPAGHHGRARRHRRGDGGVQPRARARPGRGHLLRRRHLHQPVAGPPGLPRRPRGLLRGQGRAVHPRVTPGAGVVNLDDAYGRRLAAGAPIPITTFSATGNPAADWRAARTSGSARTAARSG